MHRPTEAHRARMVRLLGPLPREVVVTPIEGAVLDAVRAAVGEDGGDR